MCESPRSVFLMEDNLKCKYKPGCSAAKTVFGAEPKDYEVQEFINRNYYRLKFRVNDKHYQSHLSSQIGGF